MIIKYPLIAEAWGAISPGGVVNIAYPWALIALNDTDFWDDNWTPVAVELIAPSFTDNNVKGVARELLQMLAMEQPNSKVIFYSEEGLAPEIYRKYAQSKIAVILMKTIDEYSMKILSLRSNIDELMDLGLTQKTIMKNISESEGTNEVNSSGSSTGEITINDSTDNTLISKYNDTRSSGDNTDLLTDTYLTNSTRNNEETVTQSSTEEQRSHTDGNIGEMYSKTESESEIERIGNDHIERYNNLVKTINSLFKKWLREFDEILVR